MFWLTVFAESAFSPSVLSLLGLLPGFCLHSSPSAVPTEVTKWAFGCRSQYTFPALASTLPEFGITYETGSHIRFETFLPWFLWPTFSCSPISLTSLYLLCGLLFFWLLAGVLLLRSFAQSTGCFQTDTRGLSTSWVSMLPNPYLQLRPVLALRIHVLTAAGCLHSECAPGVPFSWDLVWLVPPGIHLLPACLVDTSHLPSQNRSSLISCLTFNAPSS